MPLAPCPSPLYPFRMNPRTLILRTAGVNCDGETAHAFELAGSTIELIHINRLLENPKLLNDFQILALPGGFSYGDDIAAGRIFANQIAHHLHDVFHDFVAAGKPIIGICNGFQVLVKTDLLPGKLAGKSGQTCTLTNNDCGRLVDRWIRVSPRSNKCIWTADLEPIDLPIAHGEGKFVPANDEVRPRCGTTIRLRWSMSKQTTPRPTASFPSTPTGAPTTSPAFAIRPGWCLDSCPIPSGTSAHCNIQRGHGWRHCRKRGRG